MTVVFVTNFMNHHQKPLWEEFMKYVSNFKFVACSDVPEEQIKLGYHIYDVPYLVRYNPDNEEMVERMVLDADVVIFGSKPQPLFRKRILSNKTTLLVSERLFKKPGIDPFRVLEKVKLRVKYMPCNSETPFLLCAGAYVGKDYQSFGYPKEKALKWGYFPEMSLKSLEELQQNKSTTFTLLWVGRFIDWKHPEMAIEIASHLREKKVDFQLKMIGTGEMVEDIQSLIDQRGLGKYVFMHGAMSPEDVKLEMEKAHVFLMTSDRQEGWGAVVNEAMSCACTVLATKSPGSIPYLIQSGFNGWIVNKSEFPVVALNLSAHLDVCAEMGNNAYRTIHDKWNYMVAAKRLAAFITEKTIFDDGPLSYDK